jgi:hypothetical protein
MNQIEKCFSGDLNINGINISSCAFLSYDEQFSRNYIENFVPQCTTVVLIKVQKSVYLKVSGLSAWSENCKR